MDRRKFLSYVSCSCCGLILPSCTTAPITDRKQLKIIPESRLNSQAAQIYEKIKEKEKMSDDFETLETIKKIGSKMENSIENYFTSSNLENPTSNFEWDLDLDGQVDYTGSWTQKHWSEPGNYTVQLRTHGVDGRSDNSEITIEVKDLTEPQTAIYGGSSQFPYGLNQPITLTSASTDNHNIEYEEWWVDGILFETQNGTQNTYTRSFSQSGSHTFELRAYDEAGLSASATLTVTVSDATPPSVGSIIGPDELQVGDEGVWNVSASDDESNSLQLSWDFNNQINSDNNGSANDDNEANGESVEWTFSKSGTYWITVTVTNEAGLSSTEEMVVVVESKPSSKSGTSDVVTYGIFGIIAILIVVAILFIIRRRREHITHQEMLSVEAARREQEEAEAARQPSHEEQLTMFQKRDAGFSPRASGDEYAQIAGVDQEIQAILPQKQFSPRE